MSNKPFALKKRLFLWIVIDLLLLGVLLLTFAYFHHVRAETYAPAALAAFTPTSPQPPATTPSPDPSDAPGDAAAPEDGPTAPLEPTPNVTGLLGGKYAEKFTFGEVEHTDTSYRSENVCIEVTKISFTGPYLTYFLADIYIQDISSFKTAVALEYPEDNPSHIKTTMDAKLLSSLVSSVLSLSGDHFATQPEGRWVVRGGVEWKRNLPLQQDICVLYYDGVMETYTVKEADLEAITARNPYHVWSFGPELLIDGQAATKFTATNGSGTKANPRAAIGYYEPGHYCFLLVDGRQSGYSIGMTYAEMSQLFYDLGCTAAYNLDGGDSAVMCWGNEWMSHPQNENPRSAADLLYIVEPDGGEGNP